MAGPTVGQAAAAVEERAGMLVVELTEQHEDAYERFLARCPEALFYHSVGFRDFLVRLLGCEPRYAVASSGGDVVGVLPLMAAQGPFGTVLNSLPYFGSNGGLLGHDPDARAALTHWYADQFASEGVAAATVIANPLDPGSTPALAPDLEDSRSGHITSLVGPGEPADVVLGVIDGSARRNIQKAVRSGVTVDLGPDGMEVLEQLHVANMVAVGGRAKTHDFFKLVPDHFRPEKDYDVYVARVEGEAVAALLVFYAGRTVEYYVPATDVAFRPLQPLAAILHRAMADAVARGFRRWNWGGSWASHESLIRFKAKWGGRRNVYRYTTNVRNEDLLSATPDELLAGYAGFYVVPFSALAGDRTEQ